MQIGVFTVLFQDLTFEQALERAVAGGVTAVEIGTGGYPGNHHCPMQTLLASSERRQEYLDALSRRNLRLSALGCQSEPLHPDRTKAQAADCLFRQTVELAGLLGVPMVNVLSGSPAGAPGDTSPNWVTCPWPLHFLAMLDYQWNQVAIPYWREATREELKRTVLTKLNAAKGGGYIFHSHHSVPSNVPGQSYDYVVNLVRQYGRYPLQLGGFDIPF